MNEFKVTMGFALPEGFTEDQFYRLLQGSTKHSELSWWIIDFEDTGVECEE
jgi:hypothetical protein